MKQLELSLDNSREARFVRSFRARNPRSRATAYHTILPGASVKRYICVACRMALAREEASAVMSDRVRAAIDAHARTCAVIRSYVDPI
jgi:hypothetical protein